VGHAKLSLGYKKRWLILLFSTDKFVSKREKLARPTAKDGADATQDGKKKTDPIQARHSAQNFTRTDQKLRNEYRPDKNTVRKKERKENTNERAKKKGKPSPSPNPQKKEKHTERGKQLGQGGGEYPTITPPSPLSPMIPGLQATHKHKTAENPKSGRTI